MSLAAPQAERQAQPRAERTSKPSLRVVPSTATVSSPATGVAAPARPVPAGVEARPPVRPAAARDPARARNRRRDFYLFLLGVTVFFLVLGFATRSLGAGSAAVPSVRPGTPGGPAPIQRVDPGTLDVTGTGTVLAVPAGDEAAPAIAPLAGRAVTAHALLVQSVVSERAFWVGTDTAHRVLVVVPDGGVPVAAGGRVSFYGVVRALDASARGAVGAPEDERLLRSQGAYVLVGAADLTTG